MAKKANGPITGGPGGGGPGGGGPGGHHHGGGPGGPGGHHHGGGPGGPGGHHHHHGGGPGGGSVIVGGSYRGIGGSARGEESAEERERQRLAARERLLADQDILNEIEKSNPKVIEEARKKLADRGADGGDETPKKPGKKR